MIFSLGSSIINILLEFLQVTLFFPEPKMYHAGEVYIPIQQCQYLIGDYFATISAAEIGWSLAQLYR